MNEFHEIQARVAQLEQETLALKSKGKAQAMRQRFVLGLAVVGLGLAAMTHNGNTQGGGNQAMNILTAREIRVVDAEGNVVIWMVPTKDGEGNASFYNAERKNIVSISGTSDEGGGIIDVKDEEGQMKVRIRSIEGKGSVWTQK